MNKKNLLVLISACLLFSACSKKQNATVDNETQSCIDFASNGSEFISIVQMVHQAAINTPGLGSNQTKGDLTCEALTKTGGDTLWSTTGHVNPSYSLSLNYGTCNVVNDDATRSGEVYYYQNNKMQSVGSIGIIKLKNTKSNLVDNHQSTKEIKCDSIILKTLSSNATEIVFDATLINGIISQTIPNKTSKLTFNFKIKLNYFNKADPNITISGTANGINSNTISYIAAITDNFELKKNKSCTYFNSGKLDVTPYGYKVRSLNFGSRICDNQANFEVNGNTIAFRLK